jgi:hypothetical protein
MAIVSNKDEKNKKLQYFLVKKNKHDFYSLAVKKLMSFSSHTLSTSHFFLFFLFSVGTMAAGQIAVHLPGEVLNSVAECADRARIRNCFICPFSPPLLIISEMVHKLNNAALSCNRLQEENGT